MIRLKPFEYKDFKLLIDWIDSPKFLVQWGGHTFRFPLNEQQLEDYIQTANSGTNRTLIYSVLHEEYDEVIGHINLKIDDINNSGRIGKVLVGKRSLRGKGIGQLMIEKILNIAFEELKLHRVSLGVFNFNTSAISCYEKAGFVKEGLLRESRRIHNEFWSLWEMSILQKDWLTNYEYNKS